MNTHERIEQCIRMSLAGDDERALVEIESIIENFKGDDSDDPAYAHMTKGNILIQLGRHKEALAALRTAATFEHNNPSILFNLGIGEMSVGNKRRGKEYLRRAEQLGHEKASEAIKILESGGTIAISRREDDEIPDIIMGHIKRGMANVNEGRPDDAIVEYSRAIELFPEFGHTYTLLGVAYEQIQQFDKALDNHNRAIELDDRNAVAYYNRGVVHGLLGNTTAAFDDYSKSIELDPTDADAWYNRGMLQKQTEKYEEAIEDFTRAIEADPDYAMAYNDRGISYMRLSQFDEAMRDFSRALELRPNHSLFHINLGGCYINRGDNRGDVERGVRHLLIAVQLGDERAEKLLQNLTGKDIDFDSLKRAN